MTVLGTRYRLGSTSYVWPDDIVPNVRHLAPLVDDVELVLFEVDDASNLPDAATVAELNALARAHDLTYTVHLPLDLRLDDPVSLDKAAKAMAATRDLAPWAYVLHLDGRAMESRPSPAAMARWRDQARHVLDHLAALAGDPRLLCVENLENYDPGLVVSVLDGSPAGMCIDAGHFWLLGRDPLPFLDAHLARARVLHLHGVGERDHQSLALQGTAAVAPVLALLERRGYDGVVTLEVFSREDFAASRSLIEEMAGGRA